MVGMPPHIVRTAPADAAAGRIARAVGAFGLSVVVAALVFATHVLAEEIRLGGAAPAPGAAALIADLRARVLAADSATLALEGWCAEHRLADDPHLVALRIPGPDKPLSAAQRVRLAIGPEEPVRYRRVRLACGDRVLSEADNWYVPARLTPAMNAELDATRTPFGRVVAPLGPRRRTVAASPGAPAAPGADDPLFEVDALLTTAAGMPFCEVAETYLGAALPDRP